MLTKFNKKQAVLHFNEKKGGIMKCRRTGQEKRCETRTALRFNHYFTIVPVRF